MPFENVTREGRIFWLGEASAVLLADDLNALGANAITREERQQAFERLQVPAVRRADRRDGDSHRAARRRASQVDRRDAAARGRRPGRPRAKHCARGRPRSGGRDRTRTDPAICSPSSSGCGRLAPQPAATAGRRAALRASAGRRVRELHQGPARRDAGDRDQLSERGAEAASAVRPRAPGAVGRLRRAGRTRARAGRGQAVPPGSPWARRARFLAGLSQLNLKRYDDAFATFKGLGGRGTDADRPEQPRRRPAAPRRQRRRAALPTLLLRQGGGGRLPTIRITSSISATPIGRRRDCQAAIYWLREAVRRRSGRRRRPLRPRRGAGGAGQRHRSRRARRSWRAGCRPPTTSGTKRPAAEQVPKGLERVRTTTSSSRMPGGSTRRSLEQRPARSAGARRVLPRSRAAAVPSRKAIARRSPSSIARCFCRRTTPTPTCCSGASICGTAALREAIDALKISLWSAENGGGAHGAGRGLPAVEGPRCRPRAEAERALTLDPASSEARRLLG